MLAVVTSVDGRILLANRAWTDLLGHASDTVLGRLVTHFVHPDHTAAFAAMLCEIAESGAARSLDAPMRCRDGTHKWLYWQVRRDADRSLFAIAFDVSERKEEELRAERRAYVTSLRAEIWAPFGRAFSPKSILEAWANVLAKSLEAIEVGIWTVDERHADPLFGAASHNTKASPSLPFFELLIDEVRKVRSSKAPSAFVTTGEATPVDVLEKIIRGRGIVGIPSLPHRFAGSRRRDRRRLLRPRDLAKSTRLRWKKPPSKSVRHSPFCVSTSFWRNRNGQTTRSCGRRQLPSAAWTATATSRGGTPPRSASSAGPPPKCSAARSRSSECRTRNLSGIAPRSPGRTSDGSRRNQGAIVERPAARSGNVCLAAVRSRQGRRSGADRSRRPDRAQTSRAATFARTRCHAPAHRPRVGRSGPERRSVSHRHASRLRLWRVLGDRRRQLVGATDGKLALARQQTRPISRAKRGIGTRPSPPISRKLCCVTASRGGSQSSRPIAPSTAPVWLLAVDLTTRSAFRWSLVQAPSA